MRLPSLKFLHTFQVAARHLSFKDAADELSITASAVSHQIRNLELMLGVRLFRRLTRSLELTSAGQKYFDFLEVWFSRLESETRQLWSEFGRNIIRLTVPPFFASEVFLPRMLTLQADYPDTDIRVTTRSSSVREHPAEADVSILLTNSERPGMLENRLFMRKVVVACSASYLKQNPIKSYADLNGKTLIVHDRRAEEWKDWASRIGIDAPVAGRLLRSDSMFAVARAAEQGLGVALVSWPLARDWFSPRALQQLFGEEYESDEYFYLAVRDEDTERPEVAKICSWIKSEFKDNA